MNVGGRQAVGELGDVQNGPAKRAHHSPSQPKRLKLISETQRKTTCTHTHRQARRRTHAERVAPSSLSSALAFLSLLLLMGAASTRSKVARLPRLSGFTKLTCGGEVRG